MDTRARIRLLARGAALTAALGAFVAAPATADAASLKKKRPVVTSVSPLTANVGDTLKIRGRYFRLGKGKNSVIFRRDGSPALFVRADISTKKVMSVVVPKRLEEYMTVADGKLQPTKFRIRVLARRLGKRYTTLSKSPTIGPEVPDSGEPEPPGPPPADGDCDGDGIINGTDSDDDNDLLSDALETKIGSDGCKFDSDGDEVGDGYEYRSAIDLNDDNYQLPNESLPHPDKSPYPNALNNDGSVDHDGDSLTLVEEYRLWQRYGKPGDGVDPSVVPFLYYSAGMRYSLSQGGTPVMSAVDYANPAYVGGIPGFTAAGPGRPALTAKIGEFLAWSADRGYDEVRLDGPVFGGVIEVSLLDFDLSDGPLTTAPAVNPDGTGFYRSEQYYFDLNADNKVSDDERDEDGDGLTNFDEAHGRLTQDYWTSCYSDETPYTIRWAGTDLTNADSDGDGVRDGADDQDFDDLPNVMELSRNAATGRRDWSQICQAVEGLDADGADPMPEHGYRNPFNPCLPDLDADVCPVTIGAYAPWGEETPNFFVLQ